MERKNKAKILISIIFIFLGFSLIIFWNVIFNSAPQKEISTRTLFYLSGKLAGLIGFLFLSLLIFSGDTARFFDRFFGMNKIILFQRKFALITSLFVILHPVFFILANKSLSYLMPVFILTPLSIGILSFYLFIIIMASSFLYKRISYNIWQYIHITTYILFFFSLYHAANIGSESELLPIRLIYLTSLISILIGITWRTYYKIRQRTSEKFCLKEIKKETEDTFTLILETKKNFPFKAGQFCFLMLKRRGIYARHPISISSSPDEKDLKFTIKLKGRFTKEAQNLKIGEEVIVDGPFGIFTIEDAIGRNQKNFLKNYPSHPKGWSLMDNFSIRKFFGCSEEPPIKVGDFQTSEHEEKNIVFIAGGVGITPFFSMIKSNMHSKIKRNITLFYCSKTIKGTIFKKELDNIKGSWLNKIYIVSEDECQGNAKEKGIISKELIKKYLDDNQIKNSVFYICGPEMMKDCALKELKKLGVKKESIIIEDFFW